MARHYRKTGVSPLIQRHPTRAEEAERRLHFWIGTLREGASGRIGISQLTAYDCRELLWLFELLGKDAVDHVSRELRRRAPTSTA